MLINYREIKVESGSFVRFCFKPHLSTGVFNRIFYKGQAQTGTRAFGSKVGLKYFFAHVFGDAVTIVL